MTSPSLMSGWPSCPTCTRHACRRWRAASAARPSLTQRRCIARSTGAARRSSSICPSAPPTLRRCDLKGKFNDNEVVYARPPPGYRTYTFRNGLRVPIVWMLKVPLYGEVDAGYIWNRTATHQLGGFIFFPQKITLFSSEKGPFHAWIFTSMHGFANPSWICASMMDSQIHHGFVHPWSPSAKLPPFPSEKKSLKKLPSFPLRNKSIHRSLRNTHPCKPDMDFPQKSPVFPSGSMDLFWSPSPSMDWSIWTTPCASTLQVSHSVYSLPPRSMPHSHAHSTR